MTTSIQPFPDQPNGDEIKALKGTKITTHTVVLIMSTQFRYQGTPPFLRFLMIPYLFELFVHFTAFLTEILLTGFATNNKMTLPAFTAEMGKSKKIEGIGFPLLSFCVLPFVFAETDHVGFLRMQFQAELGESFL